MSSHISLLARPERSLGERVVMGLTTTCLIAQACDLMSNSTCVRAVFCAVSLLLISGCGFPHTAAVPGPLSPQAFEAAQAKFPDATPESIERGRELFTASCNKCHGHPDVHYKTAEEWPSVVERMRKKAELSEADGHLVLEFILAQNAAP